MFQYDYVERTNFFAQAFASRDMDVLSGGIDTTVQDYPGRRIGLGMPRSGPMDSLAHRAANALVGNPGETETLEMVLVGGRFLFHVPVIVAVTGAPARVTVDGQPVEMWTRLRIPAGAKLSVGTMDGRGFRVYLAVKGGFPGVPEYLGSKSTSMGLGGYQVCYSVRICDSFSAAEDVLRDAHS